MRIARSILGLALTLMLLPIRTPDARAVTEAEFEAAKSRVAELTRRIDGQQAELALLEQRSAALALELSDAQGKLERIAADLRITRSELGDAADRYDALRTRLGERARQAYMNGPGSSLGFILSASSPADLSDRLEYMNAVVQFDADLANEVQDLRNALTYRMDREEALKARQAESVAGLRDRGSDLRDQLARQQALISEIEAEKAEAGRVARELGTEYQQQVEAAFGGTGGGGTVGNGFLRVCPVGQPRGFGDDFGAPRYTGGYHPHAGNDIFAPEGTPIYAPFDGVAEDASNELGGLSVIVRGSQGWVYNAHLSRFGQLGSVSTGDVVGYVGNSGDAVGGAPHDHFEWHPNVLPTDWPASGYGYSVIGSAVNPRPLLLQVC